MLKFKFLILADEVQKMRIRLKFQKKHVFKLKIDFLSLDLVTKFSIKHDKSTLNVGSRGHFGD